MATSFLVKEQFCVLRYKLSATSNLGGEVKGKTCFPNIEVVSIEG